MYTCYSHYPTPKQCPQTLNSGFNADPLLSLSPSKTCQTLIPGNDAEVEFNMTGVSGEVETFGVTDVCYSPPVPTAFKPYPADSEITNFLWFAQGAYMSYGYR